MKREQCGLTLISLIITIVVMLILVATSYQMIVGNNGLINRTTKTVDNWNKDAVLQEIKDQLVKKLIKSPDGTISVSDIETTVNTTVEGKEYEGIIVYDVDSKSIKINGDKYTTIKIEDWLDNIEIADVSRNVCTFKGKKPSEINYFSFENAQYGSGSIMYGDEKLNDNFKIGSSQAIKFTTENSKSLLKIATTAKSGSKLEISSDKGFKKIESIETEGRVYTINLEDSATYTMKWAGGQIYLYYLEVCE